MTVMIMMTRIRELERDDDDYHDDDEKDDDDDDDDAAQNKVSHTSN